MRMHSFLFLGCLVLSPLASAQSVIIPYGNSGNSSSSSKPMLASDYAEKALSDAQRASEQQGQSQGQQAQDVQNNLAPPFASPSSATQQTMGQMPNQIQNQMPAPTMAQQEPPKPTKPPVDSDLDLQKILWMYDPKQDVRQSGQKIERPSHRGLLYSASPSDRRLLHRWRVQLMNEGISREKIDFEARRLSRNDFERWASRILWSEQTLHPNFTDVNW